MQKFEWIVTLRSKEDLDDFYDDMETPGGSITIPDRKVELVNRRMISRNTHYMLTWEEAEEVRADKRVVGVDLAIELEETTRPMGWTTTGTFSKDWFTDESDKNWGLLRHTEVTNRSNWGANGSSNVTDTVTVTAAGKNVDVVIIDGHIDPAHPEFAVNSNGTGGSRVVQYNWFQNNIGLGTGTYVYTPYVDVSDANYNLDQNHGCHCAGTVAGNTQGWARQANIYNISPYGSNPNWGNLGLSSSTFWDYIRAWHNSKPINPETGRRNPTITNNSYGSSKRVNYGNYGPVTEVNYRGVTFAPGRDLTSAELNARGFWAGDSIVDISIPNYFNSREADIQDAIDDGIIVVCSAGNDSWKTVNSTDQDFNNTYKCTYYGFTQTSYLHRGTGAAAGYAALINVGAQSNDVNEDKANFSNCGNQVDIFAGGEGIQSSVHTGGIADTRNGSYDLTKYQGTSMSGPQVTGVVALLAEAWPNITQAQAHAWIVDNANTGEMADTGTDDATDRNSLQGAPNRMLRWINQRPLSGATLPKKNFANRPTSGKTYPRTRVRARG